MSDLPESNSGDNCEESITADNHLFVVGIGASGGGLKALSELFDCLPSDSGAAFVVIQYFFSDLKSLMVLLKQHTKMTVNQIQKKTKLQPNSVYLIPPRKNLILEADSIELETQQHSQKDRFEFDYPINSFFTCLARYFGNRSIGVILSGSGNDGAEGLKAIKAVEGITLVQQPETAEFEEMPKSAISTGVVDWVLPVDELAEIITQFIVNASEFKTVSKKRLTPSYLEQITKILIDHEGLNFSRYKLSTISRRIYRRCSTKNLNNIDEYIELLKNNAEERKNLAADLLLKVTRFFRDPIAWNNIENSVLPLIIAEAEPEQELRFWVTACSTGQEAYSLAILVHEALEQTTKPLKVKIFATDIDRVALEEASLGIYSKSIVHHLTPARLQKYFVLQEEKYRVTRTLREMIVFSVHDLTKDAGFAQINFISCRNVLIYLQPDLQHQVICDLHFHLVKRGFLFLGEAENLGNLESEFILINQKWKIYRKQRNLKLRSTLKENPKITYQFLPRYQPVPNDPIKESIHEQALKQLVKRSNALVLIVGCDNQLLYVNGNSRPFFKAPDGNISTDVTKMVIPPLQLPLTTALYRAKKEKQTIAYRGIELKIETSIQKFILQVFLSTSELPSDTFSIVYIEPETIVTTSLSSSQPFESNNEAQKRILELEQQLHHTQENLQDLVEELEATNEEQQASNEELTASNEELHSVNEELHTLNTEYKLNIQELIQLSNDVDNLLKSTALGVIFLNRELKIRKFTPAVTPIISLLDSDLGRSIENFNWKIECPNLIDLFQKVIKTKQSQELEVKLKQQELYFLMRINLYLSDSKEGEGLVITFVKLDEIKQVQQKLEREIIARKLTEKQLQQSNLELEERVAQRTQALANFSDRIKQLHRLAVTYYHQLDDLFANYLQVGCQMFNFSTGIVSEVKNCVYKIIAVQSPFDLAVGYQVECVHTYCAEVVETLKTVTYTNVGKIESMQNHPVYLNLKLESFIGTPIFVNGKLYGTLNFSDTVAREEFTQNEIEIVELMAKDIGDSLTAIQTEKAFKQSEVRFRNTFEQSAVGMAHLSPEGKFLKVNQRLCEILGHKSDRLLELTFQDITHPDDLALDLEYVRQILTGKISNYAMEKRYIQEDGLSVWTHLTVSLVRDNLGQPDYFIAVIKDISDRKRVEEERQKTQIALEANQIELKQANEAKDIFIAHMSHELRTPLNSILGFGNLLQKDSTLTAKQLNFVNIINQSGQYLLALINNILDFSKLKAKKLQLKPQNFDLIEALNEIATVVYFRAQQKNLKFEQYISTSVPQAVYADRIRLKQILYNLLSNAIKFTNHGSITLTVAPIAPISQNNPQQETLSTIRFQVEDTGIGIPDDKLNEVFTPFLQLKNLTNKIHNEEGTGLGLTICQEILQLMGSKINLVSRLSVGSKFWFDLQLRAVDSNLLEPLQSTCDHFSSLRVPCRVLVVDDNQANRFLIVNYLEPLGFILAEADCGIMGIEIAKSFQPDVILVDLAMPVMNGKEMIANLKQQPQFQDVVIIILSAHCPMINELSQADYHDCLLKPIDLKHLLKLLKNHLQLEWLSVKKHSVNIDESFTLCAPCQEELIKMLALVKLGDLNAIETLSNHWQRLDTKYIPLVDKILDLTNSCQQQQLEKLLELLLK